MKIRDRIRELRRVKASDLAPNARNWRTHPRNQADALRGVLSEIGWADAVLAYERDDGSLELIDGHLRAETAGDEMVPVLVLDVDATEAAKILATHDPLAAMAEADPAALAALLEEIDTESAALQQMLDELAADVPSESVEVVEDETPEPPAEPITKPGDLWLLGEHRVLCGDSTKAEDVERLMDGQGKTNLITDPPYGIDWEGHSASTVRWSGFANDKGEINLSNIFSQFHNIVAFGANCFPHHLPHRGRWIVWDKRVDENADRMLGSPFELAWTSKKSGFDRIYRVQHGGVVNADGANEKRVHPTQKPIRLMRSIVQDFSDGNIVDLFLGSGTTLIAAEQLGRKCYGMEISPAYCDVIVKRWETLTGKRAERVQS